MRKIREVRANRVDDINEIIPCFDSFLEEDIKFIKKRGKRKIEYASCPIYLDTETSNNHLYEDEGIMSWIHQWAFSFNDIMVIGQNVIDLINQLKQIIEFYQLDEHKRVVCYIHNASYDLTYLIDFLHKYIGPCEVFALKSHKILSLFCEGIEFRCSYLLSNMSLDSWSKKIDTKHSKMVAAVDYSIIHYPDEELSIIEWEYMINDVLTLKDCIEKELFINNDSIATIPMTSTSYVRRDIRRNIAKDKGYRKWFKSCRLTVETYKAAKCAFSGGYTHGNRKRSGRTITAKVKHRDKKSMYPGEQMLKYMPVSAPALFYSIDDEHPITEKELNDVLSTYCCLIQVTYINGRLHGDVTAPYLQRSKSRGYFTCYDDFNVKGSDDNGRIIHFNGFLAQWMTELDFDIINKQYDFDQVIINKIYIMERGFIRDSVKEVINDKYFYIKENEEDTVYRNKAKNKLNAIYGLSATDICKPKIEYDIEIDEWIPEELTNEKIQELLDEYYSKFTSFNYYLIGVWTTAHARYEIVHDIIMKLIGYDNFLYCDTDSAFYLDPTGEIEEKIKRYNDSIIELNKSFGLGMPNKEGGISYYSTFEDEHDDICKFRYLHSKCYVSENSKGELSVTIAGVTKCSEDGKITSADELGSIDELRTGKKFIACGGTRAIYSKREVEEHDIEGHKVLLASSCVIAPTTKTLNGLIEGWEVIEDD